MNRKTFSLMLTLLLSFVGNNAFAYDFMAENSDGVAIYYNYIKDGKELEVTAKTAHKYDEYYDDYSGNVIIPEEVTYMGRTRKVSRIGDYAFSRCNKLNSVTIPNSITSIGVLIFTNCNSLASISVEASNLKYDSRENCNGIIETETNKLICGCQNTTIPNSVTSIGESAFYYCNSLTSIVIPNSVINIGDKAFYYCRGLSSVVIGNNVANIGERAFFNCTSLTSIDIPNSVTTIGDDLFYGCSNLTTATIGNGLTDIKDGAFAWCVSLISVTIPSSITIIGCYSFYQCKSLASITIPNSVTSIESMAFECCSSLTSVTIPYNVEQIGGRAFAGWDIPEVISKIENPFDIPTNTFNDNTFFNATLYVPKGTIEKYKAREGWKKFMFIEEGTPSSITNIDSEGTNVFRRYSLDGKVVKNPHKGINIIQMNDGKVKKVLAK